MTKQGVKGKYQRTLNEIDTNTHKTKSTNYNKVQATWVGQLQFIVIHSVHKQLPYKCHQNRMSYYTNWIVQIYMFRPLTGHQVDFPHQGHKHLSVNEYYVIKIGYDENRLTKQNHSTTSVNTHKVIY